MKKIFNYLYILIIVSIVNILNCNAECSYQERKDLLNDAKNVDIYYEVNEEKTNEKGFNTYGEEITLNSTNYIFKFVVLGLKENIYISYIDNNGEKRFIDNNNLKDGIYSFEDKNFDNVYTYEFKMYSNNEKCLGKEVFTKKIIKPMVNGYSNYRICQENGMEDYKYCQKFVEEEINISESKFTDDANKYLNSVKGEELENKFNLFDFLIKYYLYIILVIVLIICVAITFVVRRKRSQL